METRKFKPSSQYLTKTRLVITCVALLFIVACSVFLWLVTRDARMAGDDVMILYAAITGLNLVWYLPALALTGPYFRSLSYEIQEDEVIVRAGIWTHSVKHVPFRTVTNLTIKRDIADRWFFGLGTLNIQTAGMSGTTGAEETLAGLSNVDEVYEIVVRELQRFRGGMAPTAAGHDERASSVTRAFASTDDPSEILIELRAIRKALESRQVCVVSASEPD